MSKSNSHCSNDRALVHLAVAGHEQVEVHDVARLDGRAPARARDPRRGGRRTRRRRARPCAGLLRFQSSDAGAAACAPRRSSPRAPSRTAPGVRADAARWFARAASRGRAGLCCASSTGESTPAASSRSEYSAPTPRMRMRSMWLSHSSSCAVLRPVSRASASRPLGRGGALEQVAHMRDAGTRERRRMRRADALDHLDPHRDPPPCLRGRRYPLGARTCETSDAAREIRRAIPSSLRRGDACESFIGLPLHARRPRGAARAARRRRSLQAIAAARSSTLATSNGGTADPQVNATPQYWQLFQVTQDGLTAFRKSSGPAGQQRRRRSRDEAAAHDRRRPHLDADAAARRPLLERRARAAGRRALHVRAALQGARPDRRVALRRDRRRRRRVCRIPRPARSSAASR